MIKRSNQGGSLLGYIVVAVALVLVLGGGIYGLQRYSASKTGEVATNKQPTSNDGATEAPSNDSSSTSNDTKKEETPAPEQDASKEPASKPDSDTKDTANSSMTDDDDSSKASDEADDLPQTGPADTFVSLLGASALAFASASYLRSRRV